MGEVVNKKRIEYLDYLKALAIMMVTFAHILGCFEGTTVSQSLLKFCYAIELPLFFIVSGIQHSLSTKKSNLQKKAIRVLYPYITFSCFYIFFDFAIAVAKFLVKGSSTFHGVYYDFLDFITTWGIGPLWFLPVMLFAEILFYFLKDKRIISIIISILGVVLGYYLEGFYDSFLNHTAGIVAFVSCSIARVFVAYSFIFIGYYGYQIVKKIADNINNRIKRVSIGCALVFGGGVLAMLNPKIVDLHFGYCRNPIVTYISAILLFEGLFLICFDLKSNVLSYLGKHTLEYMGLQLGTGYLAKIAIKVCAKLGIVINPVLTTIACFLVFMFISSALVWFMNNKAKWIINMEAMKKI